MRKLKRQNLNFMTNYFCKERISWRNSKSLLVSEVSDKWEPVRRRDLLPSLCLPSSEKRRKQETSTPRLNNATFIKEVLVLYYRCF